VVAHHVGIPGIPGGFVGVDVFFVISGYLITSILAAEAGRSGTVSLRGFYARRVRRLFPALVVMLIATCALGAVVLLPVFGQQPELGRSAVATALYVSNFHFWLASPGYFDPSAELMPLLHTWSLAVEEQFYIGWPPLVLGAAALARRGPWSLDALLKGIVAAVLVASLAWCVVQTGDSPTAAFYLLPARAWELATGAALALWMPAIARERPLAGALCSAAGILAVVAAVLLLHRDTAFPGIAATMPVFGTALVILGGSLAGRNPVQRVLSTGPMVWIGLVSYSWYLWHWPLLALTRAHELEVHDPARDAGVALVALLIAYASYRWVENPVRYGRPGPFARDASTLVAGAVASLAVCGVAAALIVRATDAANRPSLQALAEARADHSPLRELCHQDIPFEGLAPASACIVGSRDRAPRLVLWGDSHAEHLSPLMAAFARKEPSLPVLVRSFSRCPPIDGFTHEVAAVEAGCRAFNQAMLAEIAALRPQGLEGVVLAGRWLRAFGAPPLSGLRAGNANGLDHPAAAEGLARTVAELRGLGLKVVIVAPLPELPYDAPACLARRPSGHCDVPRQEALAQRAEVMRLLQAAAGGASGVLVLDFFDAVCDEAACRAAKDGDIHYRDDHHLTAAKSRDLLPLARAALEQAAAPSRPR
jgi:peptidoglycan/LPS O-acetylase OafA/YrhL